MAWLTLTPLVTWRKVDARSDDDFVVAPDERLDWFRTIGLGAQHVVAMFGATFLVPVLTGFPPATTLLFSGVGTVLFLLITGNRLLGLRQTRERSDAADPAAERR